MSVIREAAPPQDTPPPVLVEAAVEPLCIADRCDKKDCGAQALVRWTNENPKSPAYGMHVDHCGHHSRVNGTALMSQGFAITEDVRDTINAAPSPSASV